MRWQLLDISSSAQESALELWVIHSLEKKYQSSSYVDSLIIGIAKICFTFQFSERDEKAEMKGKL